MSQKLASLRRDLEHIRRHRTQIIEQRDRLAKRLVELNKDLRAKKISYELYEDKFKYLLGGKTVEEKKKYFKKRLEAIKHREKDLQSRIKHETHVSKSRARAITAVAAMLVLFVPIMTFTAIELTGFATTATSSVSGAANVSSYYAASLSDTEIAWSGTLNLGTTNNNASGNYNTSGGTDTGYNLHLSNDSNVDIDICISGTGNFVSGSNTIGIGNLAWSANETNSLSLPAQGAAQSLSTTKVVAQQDLTKYATTGNYTYFRYWLDVPSDAGPGTYDNTSGNANITFTTTISTEDCTA